MSTLKLFIFVLVAIALIAPPATAQKGGDPYDPHNRECISPEWVVVANGRSEADVAVAGTLVARADGFADMLYVSEDSVPSPTHQFLQRKYAETDAKGGQEDLDALYIVGGKDVVSDRVVKKLEVLGNFHTVRRVDGNNREQTAAIANHISGRCK